MRRRHSALALLSLLLSACASAPPASTPPVQSGAQRRYSGRLALSLAADSPSARHAKGGSAGFELLGTPQAGVLSLISPLGTLMARVRWSAQQAWLQQGAEDEQLYDSMDALLAQLLGEALPLAALFDWLHGQPWSGAAHDAVEPQAFVQLGWRVDLRRMAEGLLVASKLGPNPTEPLAVLRVKLDQD
ncbi:lipoprotein insertase outer membrane protein LolB [Roseateles sp. BYS180W]|uniref:Outer-membrane lipoprotein LolB n=1 Tax=Roseateles rivi TaxID=3299028 RepID=A0ABW7FXD6_9BURK